MPPVRGKMLAAPARDNDFHGGAKENATDALGEKCTNCWDLVQSHYNLAKEFWTVRILDGTRRQIVPPRLAVPALASISRRRVLERKSSALSAHELHVYKCFKSACHFGAPAL